MSIDGVASGAGAANSPVGFTDYTGVCRVTWTGLVTSSIQTE